ncbi:MAG: hypothetical protein M3494_16775 [Actinomycetota bacterium]|jgi:hypothetical protein|nr:hypothetical protein [Rubrobacter sp.]MDQ3509638.1 hypothetical protein [Actinomycetota bacterium]
MGLLRTILALVILFILVHVGLVYLGIERTANAVTEAIYGLGFLVESPATIILGLLGTNLPDSLDPNGFFVIALTAAAAYFVLYLLLGIGRR